MAISKLYGPVYLSALRKQINWDTDDIRVILVSSGYSPNQDTHQYLSDVVANEVTGTGYTANGQALSGKTMSYDGSTNTVTLDASDVVWANSTIQARYAVVFNNTGASASAKPLIGYMDFGADVASTSGNFVLEWDATGIVKLTVA